MIKLTSEIFLFKNILPANLIDKLLDIRHKSGHDFRINLHEVSMDTFYEFDSFFTKEIESKMMDEYFSVYDIKRDVGYNVSEETINNLKNWLKTKWRDLFLLNYNLTGTYRSDKDVHWDFSGLTTIGCLSKDFEGGELVFPRHNVIYKLDYGDVITFPGGITHPHYVTLVTKGVRDVVVGQSTNLVDNHKLDY